MGGGKATYLRSLDHPTCPEAERGPVIARVNYAPLPRSLQALRHARVGDIEVDVRLLGGAPNSPRSDR
jgi:hypothetical protein